MDNPTKPTASTDPLPLDLRQFVESTPWTFAKTYAKTWPHEYIVRDRVDANLFTRLVLHVREQGYDDWFYHRQIRYFAEAGHVYWTMGEPVNDTTIVNRCLTHQTYTHRKEQGTLPG